MKLSILIPVYNEEQTIKQLIHAVDNVRLTWEKELIVIDDGSTDKTFLFLKKMVTKNKLVIIRHQKNKGKGTALISGIKKATGDYFLVQDADLEYDPKQIPLLLKQLSLYKNKIAVFGSRFKSSHTKIPFLYYFGNKFLTFTTNFLYGTKLTDMETCYKLLPTQFMKSKHLISSRFEIEPEFTSLLIKNRVKIIELPITYLSRSHKAGKKLTFMDGFATLKILFLYRFNKKLH